MLNCREKVMEYRSEGLCCAQVLIKAGLELKGSDNDEFLNSAAALCGGLGRSGNTCGALTGACLMLGLFLCGEEEHPRSREIIGDFVRRFTSEITAEHGGSLDCSVIIEGVEENKKTKCPELIVKTLELAVKVLNENGIIIE